MLEAYIYDGLRTPFGRHAGSLSRVRPDDLLAGVVKEVVARSGFSTDIIDDVSIGCANQAGEDNRNVARMALLLAGLPVEVPGATINRLCGSGMDAVGTRRARSSAARPTLMIAGGVESMSRAPFVMPKAEQRLQRAANAVYDTTIGWRFVNPLMKEQYGVDSMPETGRERGARLQDRARGRRTRWRWRSQQKAVAGAEGRLLRRARSCR